MPFQLSIQPVIDAQTSALNTTINAARDNVKADNVTQIGTQTTSITTAITAARDAINTNVDTDTAAVTTAVNAARDAVNANTNTKTGDVTTAVNAKGTVKSVQRGTANTTAAGSENLNTATVVIASVNTAKSIVFVDGVAHGDTAQTAQASFASATQISIKAFYKSGSIPEINWQVIEFF